MSLESALEALKRKDFAAARTHIAAVDEGAYGIQHFLVKGLAESAMADWSAARETFTLACQKFSAHALFWFNRGVAEENCGAVGEAIASQLEAVRLNPIQAEACGNLSNLYRKKKLFVDAEAMARKALKLSPQDSNVMNTLGLALAAQGKFTEADICYCDALKTEPHNSKIIINRANLKIDQLQFDEAWGLFAAARAIEDSPTYRYHEALARLLAGDFETGWRLFEARLEMPNALRFMPPCPMWHGEDLMGKKLLIVAEQGYGDMIHFCRYQEFIVGGELVWAVPKPMVRLLAGALRGAVLDEKSALPACDYYVPVMSLPLVTERLHPLPNTINLQATIPLERSAPLPDPPRKGEGKERKIGLVWAGSPTHERDYERSVPLATLAPIINSVDADFYALQMGDAVKDSGALPITRLDHLITDFADTAALLKQLDYLITVDTAVAHLAGTLGVKTFLLLSHCPDWRWGVAGKTTEWYSSVTLIRQPKYGDWQSVITQLKNLLKSSL